MPKVVHFEIPATQPERSIKFYQDVFDWKFTKWENDSFDYWMIDTGDGEGINGGLVQPMMPMNAFVNIVGVDDIDLHIQRVKDSGGEVLMDKQDVPGIGWVGYAKDPDGVMFGIIQPHPRG